MSKKYTRRLSWNAMSIHKDFILWGNRVSYNTGRIQTTNARTIECRSSFNQQFKNDPENAQRQFMKAPMNRWSTLYINVDGP